MRRDSAVMAECLHVYVAVTFQHAPLPRTAARGASHEWLRCSNVRRRDDPGRSYCHAVCVPDDRGQTRTQDEPTITHPRGPRARTSEPIDNRPQHRDRQGCSPIFRDTCPPVGHSYGTTQGLRTATGAINFAGIIDAGSRQGCQTQFCADDQGAIGIIAH